MRRVPEFKSDKEAEEFLETDLSDPDFSQFQPVKFAIGHKTAQISLHVPEPLLDAVELRAKARGISNERYIRELMERDVARTSSGSIQADPVSACEQVRELPAEGRGRAR
ncbi:CopG family antitoxin [uncultured Methylobacterium sp.]|uniref:CopG family antitoxin n=1 Tax=uncultured Methylobacterium sp. TaxID=157278 RepID=UPI0035CAB952